MSSFRDLARQLREVEEPLSEPYKELRSAAATRVEQELSTHLADAHRAQLSCLSLMTDELPPKFLALGTICSQATKLREEPGGGDGVLAELTAGMPVIVMEWAGYWAHIQLPGGRRGYVFGDYVRTDDGKRGPNWQQLG